LKYDAISYTPYVGLNQWFSKWVESPLRERLCGARGRKNTWGARGAKQRKGGENAQPLPAIDL